MLKTFFLLILLTLTPTSLVAGSRGVDLAFVDVTTGPRSPASLRLAELLIKDMKQLYISPQLINIFPWSEDDLKLRNLKSTGLNFDRLLNTKDAKKISALFEKNANPDGLIVFFHDEAHGFARIKLYNYDGKELLLVRLPLEGKKSPMPSSLLKQHRHGALLAIGTAVRWSP